MTFVPKLNLRSQHRFISTLKRFLNELSQPALSLPADAFFDAQTHQAVVRFQQQFGLSAVSGIVDLETWEAIAEELGDQRLRQEIIQTADPDLRSFLLEVAPHLGFGGYGKAGGGLVLANATAKTRIRQILAPGLTPSELSNIRIVGNKVRLQSLRAVDLHSSSPAYKYLRQLIRSRTTTFNFYLLKSGESAPLGDGIKASYQDAYISHGITSGTAGDTVIDVVVPLGGSTPVKALPRGSGNTTPMPDDVIFAHEAYGHALHKNYNDAVAVENEYRANRNPTLPPRSGEDHEHTAVEITAPPELLPVPDTTLSPNQKITPIPLEPLPTLTPRPPGNQMRGMPK